jgi:hypothetical protein
MERVIIRLGRDLQCTKSLTVYNELHTIYYRPKVVISKVSDIWRYRQLQCVHR